MIKHINASIVEKSFDAKTVLETGKMKFIISTATKDRGREVINMENWQLEPYKYNPIVGYQHAIYWSTNPDLIIGKSSVNIDTYKGKKTLVAEAEFEPKEINELAYKVTQKLAFGSLNTASVGITPIGKGKIESDTYYYDGQELLEWSVVNIPMNSEAVGMKTILMAQAKDFLKSINLPDSVMVEIEKAIEKQYGKDTVTIETKGSDPDLNKYIERLNKIQNGQAKS